MIIYSSIKRVVQHAKPQRYDVYVYLNVNTRRYTLYITYDGFVYYLFASRVFSLSSNCIPIDMFAVNHDLWLPMKKKKK